MPLTELEQRVAEEILRRREELVELATDLIRFDTSAREPRDAPRDERPLQEYLEARLRESGAETDLWEPPPEETEGSPLVPPGLSFGGRPQLVARFRGSGRGKSLLLNGHVDVVSAEPRERWSSDPFRAEVRDGNLYGRGACDMKGGVAAMVCAAEVLAALGVRLEGDLLVNTVTDEESTGAGAAAAVGHGVRADAGVVPEASSFDVWVACRGSLIPTVTIPGRAGHAGIPHPHWREGGAVNAISKSTLVVDALRRLEEEWRTRPDHRHPHLSPGDIVPTLVSGGEWMVSYPASCRITYHVAYLPGHADEEGSGAPVAAEILEHVERAASTDSWLAANPPTIEWAPEVPAAEVSADEPIVQLLLASSDDVGRPSAVAGFDNWHDGATFTRFGRTPTVAFGPRTIAVAHAVDEHVPVEDLVACSQALALTAMRFCGAPAA